MIVHGREIKFRPTVEAVCQLAEVCPGKAIGNIGSLFTNVEGTSESMTLMAYFVVCLNQGYEKAKAFEEPNYEPNPLTMDETMNLDADVLNELFSEATKAYLADKQTVEVEPEKPKRGSKKKAVISN